MQKLQIEDWNAHGLAVRRFRRWDADRDGRWEARSWKNRVGLVHHGQFLTVPTFEKLCRIFQKHSSHGYPFQKHTSNRFSTLYSLPLFSSLLYGALFTSEVFTSNLSSPSTLLFQLQYLYPLHFPTSNHHCQFPVNSEVSLPSFFWLN